MTPRDTIAAVATAPGAGGIGIVRLSGADAARIGHALCGIALQPRHAHYAKLSDATAALIDSGLVLWFPAPHSFTGEDVVELQIHGAPIVLARLLARCVELGARLAEPGEFTLRAYLNGKLDLAQAEGVADLIDAATATSARAARPARSVLLWTTTRGSPAGSSARIAASVSTFPSLYWVALSCPTNTYSPKRVNRVSMAISAMPL